MVKEIVRDVMFLSVKSEKADKSDMQVAKDLLDTLRANRESCVGLAANMIGVRKCVIAISAGPFDIVMFNPKTVFRSGAYETEEGCLSLEGTRSCTRYEEIEVEYYDMNYKFKRQKFSGFTAEIIQHEIDHCNGIII